MCVIVRVSAVLSMILANLAWSALRVDAAGVVLNEIMADNRATIVNGGSTPDWIELFNTTAASQSLAGMSLSDDSTLPRKFVFPVGSVIEANAKLLIWCDDASDAPGFHTGFGLSAQGQRVALYSADTVPKQVDAIEFGLQLPDASIGRIPDGSGTWQLCQPTPWLDNSTQQTGASTSIRVNEWMAAPASGDDWLELYNADQLPVALGGLALTDTASEKAKSPIPALSYIAGHGFQLFWADEKAYNGADHANFKLSAGGEAIGLYNGNNAIDIVNYGQQQTGVSMGRLPDGTVTFVSFTKTASPAESNYLLITNIAVNEVLAHTDAPLEDAVEFLNLGSSPIDLSGWFLSNNTSDPMKYRVPNGTTLPPNGYIVFYEYQFNTGASNPGSFNFNSAHGDEVALSEAKSGVLTGYRISQKFPASANGVSMGRVVTSRGVDFAALSRRTFGVDDPRTIAEFRTGTGAPNTGPLVGPIVINEIMYHPPDIIAGASTNDNTLDEFVELRNVSPTEVLLFDPAYPANTWRLTNAVTFAFETGARMPPASLVLLVGFDPKTDTAQLADFRAKYGVAEEVPIYGPWKGKLGNDSEAVELVKPDPPQSPPHPDAGYVPFVRVEKVKYGDSAPWPIQADGSGSSLQRWDANAYGNDPANWYAGAPTPGHDNGQVEIESVSVSGGRITIGFVALPNRLYSIEAQTSLGSTSWSQIVQYPASKTTQELQFTENIGGTGQYRFYRVASVLAQ